jgi:hypothetical protein
MKSTAYSSCKFKSQILHKCGHPDSGESINCQHIEPPKHCPLKRKQK